ncbi:MAG: hypothetical protein U0165_07735 [Polyangiaceae bacterium]
MLTCDRAYALLVALEKRDFTKLGPVAELTKEIAELEKAGMLISASNEALQKSKELDQLCDEFGVVRKPGDPAGTITELDALLTKLEADQKSDWHQGFHSREVLQQERDKAVRLRMVLSLLSSHWLQPELARVMMLRACLPARAEPIVLPGIDGLFAVTQRGDRAIRAMTPKFAGKPFFEFVKGFDKSERALAAFASDVAILNNGIGNVAKMREQVVIGLLKTGKRPDVALQAFHSAARILPHQRIDPKDKMRPHRAVAAVRNENMGNAQVVEQRMYELHNLLTQAGLPANPALLSATKSLFPFGPSNGVKRFVELVQLIRRDVSDISTVYKHAARMMSASGAPNDVVKRVRVAAQALGSYAGAFRGVTPYAVAIGCMAKDEAEIPELCRKYLGIHSLLTQHAMCPVNVAPDIALEALSCPGEPAEVVGLIQKVAREISQGRPGLSDIQIAASFAKRFAF